MALKEIQARANETKNKTPIRISLSGDCRIVAETFTFKAFTPKSKILDSTISQLVAAKTAFSFCLISKDMYSMEDERMKK